MELANGTRFTVPASLLPQDGLAHLFQWWITPVRFGPAPQSGQAAWLPAGPASVKQVFTWQNGAGLPQPTATLCAPSGSSSSVLQWPIPQHFLAGQDYSSAHPGLDLAGKAGEDVHAAGAGSVIFVGLGDGGLGNTIIIDHGNGLSSLYAHLDELRISCGAVAAGQVIGTVGQTGTTPQPLLYFEIRHFDVPQNPWSYLPPP